MLRIPFTRWEVRPWLPVSLVIFLLVFSSWTKAAAAWLLIVILSGPINRFWFWLFIHWVIAKDRRPGESWQAFETRYILEWTERRRQNA